MKHREELSDYNYLTIRGQFDFTSLLKKCFYSNGTNSQDGALPPLVTIPAYGATNRCQLSQTAAVAAAVTEQSPYQAHNSVATGVRRDED